MRIAAILLAAGRSQRFGDDDKLLADFGGQPLVRHALVALEASSAADIIVVTQPGASRLMSAAGVGRWRFACNPETSSGMASSIRVGIAHVAADCAGVMIALGDMPHLTAALVDELSAAFARCNGEAIVFPEAPDGRTGPPVLWPRRFLPDLVGLDGDQGGKRILQANHDAWHPVPIANGAALFDIDTPADLRLAQVAST